MLHCYVVFGCRLVQLRHFVYVSCKVDGPVLTTMISTSNIGRHVCRGFVCVHWCTSCIQIPYLVRILKLI